MKKLIYIDNDDEKRALTDIDYVKDNMEYLGKVPAKHLKNFEVISNFGFKNRDEMMEILFNPANVITTWSMYTATHYNSLTQMVRFFNAVASAELKDLVYIDGSGMIVKALERILRDDSKHAFSLMQTIETNNIITFNHDFPEPCFRLRIELKGQYASPFRYEKIDLLSLIK